MRVIAGKYRSRVLQGPRGDATRPTSDRLRETLFNVLAPRIEGARFADLFAGSGAVGIEALSRGAEFVWFAESAAPAVATLRRNLSTLGIAGGFAIEDRSVARLLQSMVKKNAAAHIIFLDPPYEDEQAYTETLGAVARDRGSLLAPGGVVVAEHSRRTALPERVGALQRGRVLLQGDAALSFYSVPGESAVSEANPDEDEELAGETAAGV